eukprot:scaffold50420_cov35-Phaeocystis_antarctica.AAC.1
MATLTMAIPTMAARHAPGILTMATLTMAVLTMATLTMAIPTMAARHAPGPLLSYFGCAYYGYTILAMAARPATDGAGPNPSRNPPP